MKEFVELDRNYRGVVFPKVDSVIDISVVRLVMSTYLDEENILTKENLGDSRYLRMMDSFMVISIVPKSKKEQSLKDFRQNLENIIEENGGGISPRKMGIKLFWQHWKRMDDYIRSCIGRIHRKNNEGQRYLDNFTIDRKHIYDLYKDIRKDCIQWGDSARETFTPDPIKPEFIKDRLENGEFDDLSKEGKEHIRYDCERVLLWKELTKHKVEQVDLWLRNLKSEIFRNFGGEHQTQHQRILEKCKTEEEIEQENKRFYEDAQVWNLTSQFFY